MDNKKLFMIGEVAKMFHISMGTLIDYGMTNDTDKFLFSLLF